MSFVMQATSSICSFTTSLDALRRAFRVFRRRSRRRDASGSRALAVRDGGVGRDEGAAARVRSLPRDGARDVCAAPRQADRGRVAHGDHRVRRGWYFGGGIQRGTPGFTHFGRPLRVLDLGETHLPREVFEEFLVDIAPRFTMQTYHLLRHNCNNFSDEVAQFLVGEGIYRRTSCRSRTRSSARRSASAHADALDDGCTDAHRLGGCLGGRVREPRDVRGAAAGVPRPRAGGAGARRSLRRRRRLRRLRRRRARRRRPRRRRARRTRRRHWRRPSRRNSRNSSRRV